MIIEWNLRLITPEQLESVAGMHPIHRRLEMNPALSLCLDRKVGFAGMLVLVVVFDAIESIGAECLVRQASEP